MEFQSTAAKSIVGVVCMITATPTISNLCCTFIDIPQSTHVMLSYLLWCQLELCIVFPPFLVLLQYTVYMQSRRRYDTRALIRLIASAITLSVGVTAQRYCRGLRGTHVVPPLLW